MACLSVLAAHADNFDDDFSVGAGSLWLRNSNQPLYTMDDTQGDIRFSKPAGGTFGFQYINLDFRCRLAGDFDVSVTYRNASISRLNGTPGNQVQLNAIFGSQYFGLVRSDEVGSGQNAHVWADPPRQWRGFLSTGATTGTLRIQRSGTTVRAWHNTTLIHSGTYNSAPVTRLWLSLQNNGTKDATAVTFDDFHLSATSIGPCGGTVEISGTVASDCQGPLPGVTVDVLAGSDFISTLTMEDGSYLVPSLAASTDAAEVSVELPLGFGVVAPTDGHTSVGLDRDQVVDFDLNCLATVGAARGMGYWKHQANVWLSGHGSAEESQEDMETNFPEIVFQHFHENGLKAIEVEHVTFEDDGGGPRPLSLAEVAATLGVKGVDMSARAKQQYLALLLNLASGKLQTFGVASQDGATVSQVVQYIADVINDGDPANDVLAKSAAEAVNEAQVLDAGVVPAGYVTIYYSRSPAPGEGLALTLHPNPARRDADVWVAFTMPVPGTARLNVYNVLGQKVATLVDQSVSGGVHRVRWNLGRTSGGDTPPGVYFARLETPWGSANRRIILIQP